MIRQALLAAWLLAAAGQVLAQAQAPAAPSKLPDTGKTQAPATGSEAVIGVLNKRLSTTAEFRVKPGEEFRFGSLTGVMRACERTAPWENRQEQGAFVQLVETPPALTRTQKAPAPRTIFSGWLFARSPSLNALRHPVYDVWLKSCAMDFPAGPPASTPSRNQTSGGSSPGNRGKAAASGGG